MTDNQYTGTERALKDLEYCLECLDENRLARIALSAKDHWPTIRQALLQMIEREKKND